MLVLVFCFSFLVSQTLGIVSGIHNDYYMELIRGTSSGSSFDFQFNLPFSQSTELIFPRKGTGFTLTSFFMLEQDASGDILKIVIDPVRENSITLSYTQQKILLDNADLFQNIIPSQWYFLYFDFPSNGGECKVFIFNVTHETTSEITSLLNPIKPINEKGFQCKLELSYISFKNIELSFKKCTVANSKFFFQSLNLSENSPFIHHAVIYNSPRKTAQIVQLNFDGRDINVSDTKQPELDKPAYAAKATTAFEIKMNKTNQEFKYFNSLVTSFWFIFEPFLAEGSSSKILATIFASKQIDTEGSEFLELELLPITPEKNAEAPDGQSTNETEYVLKLGDDKKYVLPGIKPNVWTHVTLTLTKMNYWSKTHNSLKNSTLIRLEARLPEFNTTDEFLSFSYSFFFDIYLIPSISFGPFPGLFKDVRIFNGSYFNFEYYRTNCMKEISANWLYINETSPNREIASRSEFSCLLCNQTWHQLDSGEEYLRFYWNGSKCDSLCPEHGYFLDYSVRFCRSCMYGTCFASYFEGSGGNSNRFECGNSYVQPYFGEQCDPGIFEKNSSADACNSKCELSEEYICIIDRFGGTKCNECNVDFCTSVVNNTYWRGDIQKQAEVHQCKENCQYFLQHPGDEESENFYFIDGKGEKTCGDDYFQNLINNNCEECTISNINNYLDFKRKSKICEEDCQMKWKSGRNICSKNYEKPDSVYLGSEKSKENIFWKFASIYSKNIATFFLILMVIEWVFLLLLKKSQIFWLFWEFMCQCNILLYVNYSASTYIDTFLLFGNFTTYRYHLGPYSNVFSTIIDLISKNNYNEIVDNLNPPAKSFEVGRVGLFMADAGNVIIFVFILWVIKNFVDLFTKLLRRFLRKSKITKVANWIYVKFNFNIFLRNIQETYIFMTFWAFIQLKTDVKSSTDKIEPFALTVIVISYIMAVVCVVFISFGFPAFTAYINQIYLPEKPEKIPNYSVLFSGYSNENWFSQNFALIRLIRNFIIAVGIGLFDSNAMIQCTFIIPCQVLILAVVGTINILDSPRLNFLFLFMTVCINIVYLITSLEVALFYIQPEINFQIKIIMGLTQVCIILIVHVVSFFVILVELIGDRNEIKKIFKPSIEEQKDEKSEDSEEEETDFMVKKEKETLLREKKRASVLKS